MAEIEKVIKDLVALEDTYERIGNPIVASLMRNTIHAIRELREDCNRYHEWGMHEGYEDAKEQIPKWHLVADGDLPPIRKDVLIALKYGGMSTGYLSDDYFYVDCVPTKHVEIKKVIAWMELPKFEK